MLEEWRTDCLRRCLRSNDILSNRKRGSGGSKTKTRGEERRRKTNGGSSLFGDKVGKATTFDYRMDRVVIRGTPYY
jgi:hypothetical protein